MMLPPPFCARSAQPHCGSHVAAPARPEATGTEPTLQWYCLTVHAKREHLAAQQLAQRTGIETFAPRLALRRSHRSGTPFTSLEALFPGYLFARFHLAEQSRFVASSPDVTGIVRFGSHIPSVPDTLIELLRRHASVAQPRSPVLEPGAWVEVLAGCFTGSQGRVIACDSGPGRAWVLLAFLGHDLRVNLPTDSLRRHGPAHLDYPPPLLASCG